MAWQHCQLSHCKWSHRLLCIWNAPTGGKSEIGPQPFESRVKAVGQNSFSAWIADFVLYDLAGPAPSPISCVRDRIRGTKARCSMTQPFVLKVLFRVMFPAPISCQRTPGCRIHHTITHSVMSGLSALHLAFPKGLQRTACTLSDMICRYMPSGNRFVYRQFNLQ